MKEILGIGAIIGMFGLVFKLELNERKRLHTLGDDFINQVKIGDPDLIRFSARAIAAEFESIENSNTLFADMEAKHSAERSYTNTINQMGLNRHLVSLCRESLIDIKAIKQAVEIYFNHEVED